MSYSSLINDPGVSSMSEPNTADSGTSFGGLARAAFLSFFEYDTPKIVHIKSKKVGLINRLLQLVIIGYIIGYVLVYEKGYQSTDEVVSAVTTKMKGVAYTNISGNPNLNIKDTEPYDRIWDVSDYVIPPQQTDAFFVMTNMIISPNQKRGICPEDPDIPNSQCSGQADCPADTPVINGNGVRTGNCVEYQYPNGSTTKTCEVRAWCPVEFDEQPLKGEAVLAAAENFTVLIKNSIQFTKYNVSKRNILEDSNSTYLQSCHYNSRTDEFCPVFALKTIAEELGEDFSAMAYKGAAVGIMIKWDCNLDHGIDSCRPDYSFRRLDNKNALIAPGYNFRYSMNYQEGGVNTRTQTKAYGILFKVIVTGEAGKFDIVPLILNIASGLALLSLASIMADICVLYLLKKRFIYRQKKYLMVEDKTHEEFEQDVD